MSNEGGINESSFCFFPPFFPFLSERSGEGNERDR